MIPSGEKDGSSGFGGSTRRDVEVAAAKKPVRAALSLPSGIGRAADRKKVLERARRMLVVALDEEGARSPRGGTEPQPAHAREARPGCGAWWLF